MVHKQASDKEQKRDEQQQTQQKQNISSLNPVQQDDADDVLQAFIQEKDPNGDRC